MAAEATFISIGDVAIELQRTGQGRPLLLLAGEEMREADAPFVTVGRLTILPQALDGEEGKKLTEEVEKAKFDPWNALAEHRPLGGIMRARKPTYFKSQQARGSA